MCPRGEEKGHPVFPAPWCEGAPECPPPRARGVNEPRVQTRRAPHVDCTILNFFTSLELFKSQTEEIQVSYGHLGG